MLIETLVLVLVVGYLKGGKFINLGQLDLRGVWLIPFAFIIQMAVYWSAVKGFRLGPGWVSPVLHTLSYLLLLVMAVLNLSQPGMKLLALGIALNGLVIAVNSGLMPVDPTFLPAASRLALQPGEGTHQLLTGATRLSFLADRDLLYIPALGQQLFSAGDIFIDIGSFMLVFGVMTGPRAYRIRSVHRH